MKTPTQLAIPILLILVSAVSTGCSKVKLLSNKKTVVTEAKTGGSGTEYPAGPSFGISAGGGISKGGGMILYGVIGNVAALDQQVAASGGGIKLMPLDPMPAREVKQE